MWIDAAVANAGQAAAPSFLAQVFPFVIIIIMFYFLILRPQQKRAKEHKKMITELQKGDEVLVGGVVARVVKLGDDYLTVEIADGVTMQVQRGAVGTKLEKGTFKNNK